VNSRKLWVFLAEGTASAKGGAKALRLDELVLFGGHRGWVERAGVMLPQGWGKRPALVGGSRRPENSPDGTHLGASSGWVGKGWPKEERRHGYQPKFTSPFPLISADLLSLPFSHSLGVSLSLPLCSCPLPHTP
jgi:hypothetical protein